MYVFAKGCAKSSKNVFNKFFCVYFPPSSSLVVAAFAFVMFVEDKGIGKLYILETFSYFLFNVFLMLSEKKLRKCSL